MVTLTATQMRGGRLRSLLLADHPLTTAAEVVSWFGAMQAQDPASGLWSLGLRLPGASEQDMLTALEDGAILRTWPMRGTIHLVPSEDAGWMLDLMGGRAHATGLRRREQLGLTQEDADRAVGALAGALSGGRRLPRAKALAAINGSGITTEGQRGYHLLRYAAQTGVTCIGPQVDGEQTFVLLSDWVRSPRRLDPREAAAELAFRYFRSHGPATAADFAGWTGLPLGTVRQAIADNEGRLVPATVEGSTVWLTPETREDAGGHRRTVALPGFDELLLGYKDRTLHVPSGRMDDIVPGGNGVFRATIVSDGVVQATWTRQLTPSRVKVTLQPFGTWSQTRRTAAERAVAAYAGYLGRTLSVTVKPLP
jgi:hypothetical protein